ncbi:hypothetical protein EDO6_00584 [Paenibacillus xylanexedens]|nr:hypothetical protein EDO6_00584 [Paenibacillus xylanexedens]
MCRHISIRHTTQRACQIVHQVFNVIGVYGLDCDLDRNDILHG